MRIWLITVGEPLPTDPGGQRLLRTGILADLLAREGHEVVWWTSTFDHTHKRQRADTTQRLDLPPRGRLILLRGRDYRRNVSFRRVLNHRDVARAFRLLAEEEPVPDILLCSLPTLELGVEATAYGRRRGVPVIVDVRDFWPDAILDLVPRWLRPIVRWTLAPMFRDARAACASATAVCGVTEAAVDWGAARAGRPRSPRDRSFHLGYSAAPPPEAALREAEAFWDARNVRTGDGEFRVAFFGALSRQFDLDTVLTAVRRLGGQGRRFRVLLCGEGDRRASYERSSGDLRDLVVFPGWITAPQIWVLMRRCSIGLAPYVNTANFQGHIPNKVIEYLSAGLPILSSLEGACARLLSQEGCGVSFGCGDAGSLVSALDELLRDPPRLRPMADRAAALYEARFRADQVYGDMVRYLVDVAGGAGR